MGWQRRFALVIAGLLVVTAQPAAAADKARHKAHAKSPVRSAKPVRVAARPAGPALRKVAHAVPPRRAGALDLRSNVALVIDSRTGEAVVAKNINDVQPIASITKLMTALVVLESRAGLTERIAITEEDVDTERGSRSRLRVGAEFSRGELLHLALMASENRAAHALGRSHPDGLAGFTAAMNEKARSLGMARTRFVDPTGLSSANVSTAADLVRLVHAAHALPLIREYSTDPAFEVNVAGRDTRFHNTNRLVASDGWEIGLSKTGFINEAGRCLVMHARVAGRNLTFVLLDSWGKLSRIGDANRIRKWLTTTAAAGQAA